MGQIANYNLGSVQGEVRITYDGRGVDEAREDIRDLGEGVGDAGDDIDEFGRRARRGSEEARNLGNESSSAADKAEKLGSFMSKLMAPIFLAGAAPAALGLAAGATAAAGAVGVLPALLGSVKLAMAAVTIGTEGFGEALSAAAEGDMAAFNEQVAKMPPNMAQAARATAALIPAWNNLKLDVQNRLWDGLGTRISSLGARYIPVLQTALGSVATSLNGAGTELAEFFDNRELGGDVTEMFEFMALAVDNVSQAISPVVQGLYIVARVGSEVLADITAGAGNAAMRFREWIGEMRASGQLEAWIRAGIQALVDFGAIIGNIIGIVRAVFSAFDVGGQSMLTTIREATAAALLWAQSAEGQRVIGDIWNFLVTIATALGQAIGAIVFVVTTLISWFSMLPAPVQSIIASFITWATIIGVVIGWLAPLIGFLAGLGPVIMTVVGVLGSLWNAFTLVMTIFRALTMLLLTNPFVLLIAAVVALAALIFFNWDAIWAKTQEIWGSITGWLSAQWQSITSTVSAACSAVLNAVVTAWNNVVSSVSTFVSNLVNNIAQGWANVTSGASTAWANVVSTISNAISTVINAVANWISNVVSTATTGWQNMLSMIVNVWSNVISSVTSGAGRVWGEIVALGSRIAGFAGQAINLLVDAGRNIVLGLWNGIVAMGGWLAGQIWGWIRSVVPGPILQFLGIASPSRYMRDEVGKMIPPGVAEGIDAKSDVAADAARQMAMDVGVAATHIMPDMQHRIGALATSTAAAATGRSPVMSVAAASTPSSIAGMSGSTINIGSVIQQIAGNLDPTNPVAWRSAVTNIKDGIRDLEASYR